MSPLTVERRDVWKIDDVYCCGYSYVSRMIYIRYCSGYFRIQADVKLTIRLSSYGLNYTNYEVLQNIPKLSHIFDECANLCKLYAVLNYVRCTMSWFEALNLEIKSWKGREVSRLITDSSLAINRLSFLMSYYIPAWYIYTCIYTDLIICFKLLTLSCVT